MTAFERVASLLAPRWAHDRVRARAALETFVRHYEAASPGRRTNGWARTASDADVVVRAALAEIRMHARDLVRNNAWAKRGQRVVANHTAGWGIRPKAIGGSAGANTVAAEAWRAWAETTDCDADGRHNIYGLQHLIMKSIYESGEVLIRRRYRRAKDGLDVPIQLQVLEADFLDHGKNFVGDTIAGGPIIAGVEFDKLGKRAAYWLYPVHPGSGRNSQVSKRVPADDVLHVFYADRPGQTRGISWLGAAIVNLKDLDDYEEAELIKVKIASCFVGFVVDTDGTSASIGIPGQPDGSVDSLAETFEPGMIAKLPPGRDVRFGNPPTTTDSAFAERNLRKVASAIGVTYEDFTGDYSKVNYSSARMARTEHWANVHDWQENMLIPLFCAGVWGWMVDALQGAGELPADDAPTAQWTAPAMPMLEPDKEGLAYQRLVRTGAMTPSQMVREQGGDPETHWAEYAADIKRFKELEIEVDVDVSKVSQAGQAQVQASGDAPKKDAAADEPPDAKSDSKN